jgi:hypothetical protein
MKQEHKQRRFLGLGVLFLFFNRDAFLPYSDFTYGDNRAHTSYLRFERAMEKNAHPSQALQLNETSRIEERSLIETQYYPRMSNRCQTPQFWCWLPAYAPVGTSCYCGTPSGPVRGFVN